MTARPRHQSTERGSALVVTLILVTALVAGGALAMHLQVSDTRSAQYLNQSRASLYCAEAGLAAARSFVATSTGEWPLMLDGDDGNDPTGCPVEGDLDDDGVADFRVEIRDNDDELPPLDNDPEADVDSTIFMVSTCLQFPDTPRQVLELIGFSGGGTNYRDQSGQGGGGTNNAN